MDDVYALIAKRYDEMSKTQKKIASYLLEEKTNASFSGYMLQVILFSVFIGYHTCCIGIHTATNICGKSKSHKVFKSCF